MPSLTAIREQRRQARLLALREGLIPILRDRPAASVWLFGSLARGDWDAFSDVDLLAVAPDQAQASALADDLLAVGRLPEGGPRTAAIVDEEPAR